MSDKKKTTPTAQHGRRKASQVSEIVQAILGQVRSDLQGQFMSLNQRLGGIEQRQRLDAAQLTLGGYREDVRHVLVQLLSQDDLDDEAAVSQAFDIADLMDAEYSERMAVRKAAAQVEAEAIAAAIETDAGDGEDDGLDPADVAGILERIAERRDPEPPVVGDVDPAESR